ncbi:unnamed protein product [Camellia sinensis]
MLVSLCYCDMQTCFLVCGKGKRRCQKVIHRLPSLWRMKRYYTVLHKGNVKESFFLQYLLMNTEFSVELTCNLKPHLEFDLFLLFGACSLYKSIVTCNYCGKLK